MIKIDDLISEALKNHNDYELRTYRAIKSEFLKFKTAKNAKIFDESAELQILKKMAQQREDSISEFQKAGREDLVQYEREELEVIQKFLPEPVKESDIYYELDKYCKSENLLSENGQNLIPKKEMGNVIKHLKNSFPTADGKLISNIVKEYVL